MEVKGISQGWQTTLESKANSTEITQNTSDNNSTVTVVSSNVDSTIESKLENNEKSVTEKDVKKAVDKLNKLLEDRSTHVEYEVYGKFKDLTISIVDNNTKQVIQELPPKKIIDMVDKLCELAGVFVDKKA